MDWLSDNLWLTWMGVALVLVAIEAATVDLVFIMLGLGALAAALAAALGLPLVLQIVVAIVTAMLLVGVVRPLVKRQFLSAPASHDIGAAALSGRAARVLETVTETDGRVRLAGETWSARVVAGGAACEPGEEVRVTSIDGATAIVTNQPMT